MPKAAFVDFKAIKAAVKMEQVLEHLGLSDKFKKSGDSLSGPCPIHGGSNPTQFRISISKNIWNCFSECKHGGNVLDFIAKMEDVSIHAAAMKAIEWFHLDPESMKNGEAEEKPAESKDEPPKEKASKSKQEAKKPVEKEETITVNKPLKFRLEKLEREHPYLKERGLTLETLVEFGAGFCAKGMMADRIAIPIHNSEGEVVAYAGRFPGEPSGDQPKYKLPQGFRKSLELFNINRALQESDEQPLTIVEGFFDCMKLHQHGYRKVVALMGSILSGAQEELLQKHSKSWSHIVVMLDEDEAGRLGREDIAARLSKFCFIKIHVFEKEDMEPENLSSDQLERALAL